MHQNRAFSMSNPVDSPNQSVPVSTGRSHDNTGLTQKLHQNGAMSMLMTCNQAWLLSVQPTKSVATHDCKGIYSHGWPYFWLGGHLATTLIVKWPGASFGGQAPRWYPRFCREAQKTKKGKVHSQWTLVQVGLMIT